MRMFSTCVTGACTVFLGFSGFSWLDARSPWFCSKGIGICSYLYTEDRGIVVFGRCADVSLGCGRCCRLFVLVLAVKSL